MRYEFSILCYVRFVSGLIAILLAILLWRKRKSAGALNLSLFELFAALWAFSDGFEAAATTLSLKLFWAHIAYIGITNSAVMFLIFCLSYTGKFKLLGKKNLPFLFIIPLITILVAFTNSFHHLLWSDVILAKGTNNSIYYYGPWFWVNTFYQYSAVVIGLIFLLAAAFRTFSFFRPQIWLLIIGGLFPLCGSIIYVFKLSPVKGIDFTPISFIISGVLIGISLYWHGFLDIVPFARQQAIDNLQDGWLVLDSENNIVSSNPSFVNISGLKSEQIIGKKISEILPILNLDKQDIVILDENTSEVVLDMNGEMKHFEVKMQPVKDNRQKIVGTLLTIHDVTLNAMILETISESNKQRLDQIIEKEKLIKDLDAYARSVAHDLRNPVSSVIGLSDITISSLSEDKIDEALEMVQMIRNLGGKMNNIINDLLLLARIRKEDIKIDLVDSAAIITEALAYQKKLITDTGAAIEKPDNWPLVYGHPQWVEQIWVNLISNAIKYGGKPPVIKIGFDIEADDIIRFWINDNGNGLPPESLARLFHDFERLDLNDSEGHGLGLSIVKRIVNKLGGEIKVDSKNIPGEGCTFSFTLKKHQSG